MKTLKAILEATAYLFLASLLLFMCAVTLVTAVIITDYTWSTECVAPETLPEEQNL